MIPPVATKRLKPKKSAAEAQAEAAVVEDKTKSAHLAGSKLWETTTCLIKGGDLSIMSKYDRAKSCFKQLVEVNHTDAFQLTPIILTEGPLKGSRVLLLKPVTDFFRFLDLPPEIRTMIYDEVFNEPTEIKVYSAGRKDGERKSTRVHMEWDEVTRAIYYTSRGAQAHGFLASNREIAREAAPLAYGSNVFSATSLPNVRAFLESIGSMRKHLRHISLGYGYHQTVATPTFHKLKDAKGLQSLVLQHKTFCSTRTQYAHKSATIQQLVADITPLMKVLQHAQKSADRPIDVLDVVKFETHETPCKISEKGRLCRCTHSCNVKCRELKTHAAEFQSKFRTALAAALGMEEVVESNDFAKSILAMLGDEGSDE